MDDTVAHISPQGFSICSQQFKLALSNSLTVFSFLKKKIYITLTVLSELSVFPFNRICVCVTTKIKGILSIIQRKR